MEKASFSEVEDYIDSLCSKKKKAKRYKRSMSGDDIFAVIMTVYFVVAFGALAFATVMMLICG